MSTLQHDVRLCFGMLVRLLRRRQVSFSRISLCVRNSKRTMVRIYNKTVVR